MLDMWSRYPTTHQEADTK
ncbi:hypothetical protein AYI69_g10483, partial [Smittium culicis]